MDTVRGIRQGWRIIWIAAMAASAAASVAPAIAQQSVVSFSLIDADADTVIGPLVDGDTLVISQLPTENLNVRANTDPDTVGSVRFALNGDHNFQTENVSPYALAGDIGGDFNAWALENGDYLLTATPWSGPGATGTQGVPLIVGFRVVKSGFEVILCDDPDSTASVTGELKIWHPITVTSNGKCAGEDRLFNPSSYYD